MRYAFKIFVFVLFTASIINAQDLSREQKLKKIEELNNQIKTLEKDVILPSAKDSEQAQKQGLNVFRIMPREIYDGVLTIRGGAAYYSFTKKDHSYNIPQIELSEKSLSVGFAGADYGFIADLGETPLAEVSKEILDVSFLANYKPPFNISEIRIEQRKAHNYEANGIIYKSRMPAVVGHTYVLRAITFDRADVLVALKVHRKDADGSLIIFWKIIEVFEVPTIRRDIEEN